jgi:DNA sulfur modification protein DndE
MSIKQVRVSSQAKEQLIRLKTKTGINQWNIVCRWALCVSLAEPTPPTPIAIQADSNVEMAWPVFGGDYHELYLALCKERCERDGLGTSDEVLRKQFQLHLHRGIGYLAAPNSIRSIADLVRLTVEKQSSASAGECVSRRAQKPS